MPPAHADRQPHITSDPTATGADLCSAWPFKEAADDTTTVSWDEPTLVTVGRLSTYTSRGAIRVATQGLGDVTRLVDPGGGNNVLPRTRCALTIKDTWLQAPTQPGDTSCYNTNGCNGRRAENPPSRSVATPAYTHVPGARVRSTSASEPAWPSGVRSRSIARYTVERATLYSSARSVVVCSPASCSATRWASCAGLSFGFLPRRRPLALAPSSLHACADVLGRLRTLPPCPGH